MNIAVSAGSTPSVINAGPMTTHEMMNDAVTGTARPSTDTATAASTAVSMSTTAGSEVNTDARFTKDPASASPSPVLVIVDVITPAAAQTAITGNAERTPVDSESAISRNHSRRWLINANSAATPVAYTTAL